MSKVKIQGNASGTGVLTISAPNTSTDRTITLPDTTGTLLDENSSVPAANLTGTVADARISALTASKLTGALPAISGASLTGLPAGGKILQVVEGNRISSTVSTTTHSSFVNSGATVAITPSATSSKILLMASINVRSYNGGNTQNGLHNTGALTLYKGSTSTLLGSTLTYGEENTPLNSNTAMYFPGITETYLDSPNTTSATTYGIAFRVGDTYSGTHYIFSGTHITAIEIGA